MPSFRTLLVCLFWLLPGHPIWAQVNTTRTLSGVVLTNKNQAVNGASLTVLSSSGPQTMTCGPDGKFQFVVPAGKLTLRVEGKFVVTREVEIGAADPTEDLRIEVDFVVPPIHNRLVIEASALDPGIDRRNEWIYQSTLFGRDDQLFHTLDLTDRIDPLFSGDEGTANFQPKFNFTYRPSDHLPLALYLHYGRGIASQDARGIVQYPSGEKVSTTDFYLAGISQNMKRFSVSADVFLIDRSNEQVYIPDDGSIEFKGPSRAYGFEAKTSLQIHRYLALNGGITKITNAFYRGTFPRFYVDSAPHAVVNGGLTLAQWYGFTGSLRMRYISNYRLDGEDAGIRAMAPRDTRSV